MKSDILADYPTWADMEVAMGQYSSRWERASDFRKVIKLLNRRLKEYLLTQEARINQIKLDKGKLINDLLNPIAYLDPANRALFTQLVNYTHPFHINWVTFNYTNTFESILGYERGDIRSTPQGVDRLEKVLHIHGLLSEKTVLGVNDPEQIANEVFRSDQYLLYEFVKPLFNAGCQNDRDSQFSSLILWADVIVLIGTSIGETDMFWWKKIGQWVESRPDNVLLYFPFDPSKDTVEDECFKGLWSEEYIRFLKDRMGLNRGVDTLKKHIFCGINTDFLRLST